MTEHWASYFCNVNGKLASIFLDIDLSNVAPDQARPWLLWVWVYFKQSRIDGLSSSEEFPTLSAMEDLLKKHVCGNCSASLVGRITTDGRREFYFYAPKPNNFEASVRDAIKKFTSYEFEHGTQHDPAWNQYLSVLFPSEDDLQKILNREVLDVLAEQGDQPEIPREVLHWAYFKTEEDRSDFKAAVQEKGYGISSESTHPGEENPFGVCLGKIQGCTGTAIDRAVLELTKFAERFKGEYDGWEAEVMADEKPDKATGSRVN